MDDEELVIGILTAHYMESLSEEVIHRRTLREDEWGVSCGLLEIVTEEYPRPLIVEDEAILMQRSGT